MGGEDEGSRAVSVERRRGGRQGDRREVSHYIVPVGAFAAAFAKLAATGVMLRRAIPRCRGRSAAEKENGQQDEIHLPGQRPERVGEARRR